MAARAKIASAGGPHAVLTNEVRVVNEVVVGHRSFVRERNVTTVAIAQAPLVLVLVATEAACHLRQDRLRGLLGDLDVTSNAVAPSCRHVLAVLETQMVARELDALAHVRLAVTAAARALVVGFGVATAAVRVRRKVKGARAVGHGNPPMALDAVDPFERVRAVFEGMG